MNVIVPASKPETRIIYGFEVPKGESMLAVELQGYRMNWPESRGGLGAERHFRNAFKLAWPKFIWHDWMELLMSSFCNERYVTVIGHSRATKTYGTAHLLYLDYCAQPFETWTSLTTTSFDGLRSRMWSDVMAAVETASFQCPFKITSSSNEMKLRVGDKDSKKDDKFMIEGFATAIGGEGRIQGKHANRRRLALDEAQELPDAIWTAEVNAGTAPDFKSLRLANPVDKQSKFGQLCCEPKAGWSSIHDTDLMWRTKNDRLVLHFDGLQCHNYKLYVDMGRGAITKEEYEKRKLPFMLSAEYVEEIRKSPGEDSLEWWMYVRGFFPGDGIVSRCFPDLVIERMEKDTTFDFQPKKLAVLDPAYEHDECVLHFGQFGEIRGGGIGIQFVETVLVPIKVMDKSKTKDEQIADFVIAACKERGVQPDCYIQDTTGNGRSVYSHISRDWDRKVQACEFGGKPTDRPLFHGDPAKCEDLFMYMVDELHFRAAAWASSGRIGGLKNLSERTKADCAARRYIVTKGRKRVESKAEVKKRLGRSPDHGDAFILVGELMARKGYLPGQTLKTAAPSNIWAKHREAAKKAASHYNEATEFSHF